MPSLELLPGERAIVPLGFRATAAIGLRGADKATERHQLQDVARNRELRQARSIPITTASGEYSSETTVTQPILITHGERIAQMVIARYEVLEFEEGEVRQHDRS